MNIDKKLKEIILNIVAQEVDVIAINDETILTTDLGFNSIYIIELIVELESQFEIEIEDDDLDVEILTMYKELYKMIERKVNNKGMLI